MDTVVDLQVQIYILAGLFGGVCIMLIFIMAALCGKVSKLKRQQRELQLSSVTANSGYDNYAYNSRTIQPDEELSRRGYSMYDPYNSNDRTLQQTTNIRKLSENRGDDSNMNIATVYNSDGTRDATSDFSAVISSETIVMAGNDTEMKIVKTNYPPQYLGVPPPPAFVNHFTTSDDTNDETNDKTSPVQ